MTRDELIAVIIAECEPAIDRALTYGGRSHVLSEVADIVWTAMDRYPDLLPRDPNQTLQGSDLIQRILETYGLSS
jgi:hypothetical protein